MSAVAPGQEALWNNFARYIWKADASADEARLVPVAADFVEMRLDPCGTSARILDFDVVVADHSLDAYDCLVADRTVEWDALDREIFMYRVR